MSERLLPYRGTEPPPPSPLENALFEADSFAEIEAIVGKRKSLSASVQLELGDFEGHPFRGNQWTLSERTYEGEIGNKDHVTKVEEGTVPTAAIAHLAGVMGEVPGEHRNKQGDKWETFKSDIAKNGIKEPIFITVDYGDQPKISEGNHRRDAAVELGQPTVPVEIRYFGHAEQQGTVVERSTVRASVQLELGDVDGHPFHGNQWVTLYHGTTERNAQSILDEGFQRVDARSIADQVGKKYGIPAAATISALARPRASSEIPMSVSRSQR